MKIGFKLIGDLASTATILTISDAHVDHVLEGLVQVVAHLLDLHLLREQIFLHLKINQQSTMCNESINQSINNVQSINQSINEQLMSRSFST